MRIGEHYKIGEIIYRAVYVDAHRIFLVAGRHAREISTGDAHRYPSVGVAERVAINNQRVEKERMSDNKQLLTQLRLV